MAHVETIEVDGSPMEIYCDGPAISGPGPAVLLMYHRGGIDGFTKSVARTLAAEGYRVAVPEVSHRVSRDIPMADRKQYLKDSEVVADMEATVGFLKARKDVDPANICVMGHCMGGRMAILGAGSIRGFRAAVVFYGGGVTVSWGKEGMTPFDGIKNIRCPVIGFFGDKDTNPSPEHVRQIATELQRCGVAYTFHHYPDIGHGFQNPQHDSPDERAAAKDSWVKTIAFLNTIAPVHSVAS